MPDLTTEWADYIVDLKAANPTAQDVTTLVSNDLATVRAGVAASAELDDANTMYMEYLTVDT